MTEVNTDKKIVRTFSTEIADYVKEAGGSIKIVHEFDQLPLFECYLPNEEMLKSQEFIQLAVDSIFSGTEVLFVRIRPELYTIAIDGEWCFAELPGEEKCLLLSRDKKLLENSVDDGSALLISSWIQMKDVLESALEEGVEKISVILGKGNDGRDYLESYKVKSGIMLANTALESN